MWCVWCFLWLDEANTFRTMCEQFRNASPLPKHPSWESSHSQSSHPLCSLSSLLVVAYSDFSKVSRRSYWLGGSRSGPNWPMAWTNYLNSSLSIALNDIAALHIRETHLSIGGQQTIYNLIGKNRPTSSYHGYTPILQCTHVLEVISPPMLPC